VKVDAKDRDRYLGVIERRVRTGRTGSRWLMFSLAGMKDHGTQGERLNALTSATIARQASGAPVAEWEPARLDEGGGWENNYLFLCQLHGYDGGLKSFTLRNAS
jgi:hypothetical protein